MSVNHLQKNPDTASLLRDSDPRQYPLGALLYGSSISNSPIFVYLKLLISFFLKGSFVGYINLDGHFLILEISFQRST